MSKYRLVVEVHSNRRFSYCSDVRTGVAHAVALLDIQAYSGPVNSNLLNVWKNLAAGSTAREHIPWLGASHVCNQTAADVHPAVCEFLND